jgi:MoaA/NifB/PqqE/SkfB family radical SAM enzyme
MHPESAFNPQIKLLMQSKRLRQFLDGDDLSPPVLVEISPTNDCNAKCPWCFYVSSNYKQKHSKDNLDKDILLQALDDMAGMGVNAVSWTGGGDPSVYPWINDAIYHAYSLGLLQAMFTNAYVPIAHPEYMQWIRITVTERFMITKHVTDYAQKTKVGVNFNLCDDNYNHLDDMIIKSRNAGVRYFQVRPALADRWDLQKPVKKPDYIRQYETDEFSIVMTDYKWTDYLKPHGYAICHGHRFSPFIWHNGDVDVCAYHFRRHDYTFGNLYEYGFRSIWYSQRRKEMLNHGINVIKDCQHNCKLHEINKTLSAVKGDLSVQDSVFL